MNIKFAKAHKLSRRMYFRDLHISIETDKGELRHWYDPHNNTKGSTKMKYPYGYIRRTKGTDGDHVDVYVGPNERAKYVYIVNQNKAPDFTKFDEQKCMLGFLSENAAKTAYLAHYDNPKFLGSITRMPYEEFRDKVLHTFDLKRPHKVAGDQMTPIRKAYLLGCKLAEEEFARAFNRKTATAQAQIPQIPQRRQPQPEFTPLKPDFAPQPSLNNIFTPEPDILKVPDVDPSSSLRA